MSRPEHTAPPEIFYGEDEAHKYATSSRMRDIQRTMSERALELLALPDGKRALLLDIGCGSGLSGEVLSDAGHDWIGVDISPAMLNVAKDQEADGDVVLLDIGHGMPFRESTFDGAISVSAVQWLCNSNTREQVPYKRLLTLFQTLYATLRRGSRAVFQFYPENPQQMELITTCAMRAGFSGGLVVDYPNSSKAKKYFLCLMAGPSMELPAALTGEEDEEDTSVVKANLTRDRYGRKTKKQRAPIKSRDWVSAKKERQARQGKSSRPDSKYTGRRRLRAPVV